METREILDNENQKINKKYESLQIRGEIFTKKKEALLLLKQIENNSNYDLDLLCHNILPDVQFKLVNGKYEHKQISNFDVKFNLIKDGETLKGTFDIEGLKNLALITKIFKENNLNSKDNPLIIKSEQISRDGGDGIENDEGKLLKERGNKTFEGGLIEKHYIEVKNSDGRNIITDLLDKNLKLITETRDEDLQKYIDIVNQIL